MVEAPSEVEQTREKVKAVGARLSKREQKDPEGQLGDIAEDFPRVVEDARRLWAAMEQDGITFVATNNPATYFFLGSLVANQDAPATNHIRDIRINDALINAQNKEVYREIYEEYGVPISEKVIETRYIFNTAFKAVQRLSEMQRESSARPQHELQ